MITGSHARPERTARSHRRDQLLRAAGGVAIILGLLAFAAYVVSLAAVAALLWQLV